MTNNFHELSPRYNLTVDQSSGTPAARQINNAIEVSGPLVSTLAIASSIAKKPVFNIRPDGIANLLSDDPSSNVVIPNPVSVVFISSKGLLNGADWTSNQPSEGIAVLSEWLAAHVPEAAPIFVDPNLIVSPLDEILKKYINPNQPAIIGFSMLPVNLKNDIGQICEVKDIIPESIMVAGGIGSDVYDLLPLKSGKKGISEASPIDAVLQGSSFNLLRALVKSIHRGEVTDGIYAKKFIDAYEQTEQEMYGEVDEAKIARAAARSLFIPYTRPDIVHRTSYAEANLVSADTELAVVSVLLDNSCDQGCYFCASPKQAVFNNVDEMVEHILDKSVGSDVIAFNDNDLSNNVEQTIALCTAMNQAGIKQEKHGKMRANKYVPNLLEALAGAGFKRLAVGVESFDPSIRAGLSKKDFTDSSVESNLKKMIELGIIPEINIILFTPRENDISLKNTVEGAIRWINEGCQLYVTVGLFATPNSPAVKLLLSKGKMVDSNKINFQEIYQQGMKDTILFPAQWSASEDMSKLQAEVLARRKSFLDRLEEIHGHAMPVPVEAFIAIALLAQRFQLDGYETPINTEERILEYAQHAANRPYISI